MNGEKPWTKVLAVTFVTMMLVAGIYLIVSAGDGNGYNIINPVSLKIAGQKYTVSDLLCIPEMDITTSELKAFESFDDLRETLGLTNATDTDYYYRYSYADNMVLDAAESGTPGAAVAKDHSSTNIQVAGVDEGDVVKNDDRYAYVVSGDARSVFIIDVYPPRNARILAEIQANGSINEIYLNGDSLVVVEQCYYFDEVYLETDYYYSDDPVIAVNVFDIKDKDQPRLVRNDVLAGCFMTSRIVDDNLYVIGTDYSRYYENESDLPLPLDSLYYIENEMSYSLTTFMSVDLEDEEAQPIVMGIFMSSSNNIYVSLKNIYITHEKNEYYYYWDYDGEPEEKTVIHRISVHNGEMKYRARGEVPGRILNRFSMDEYGEHFRVATTKGQVWRGGEGTARNQVHVLNMGMHTVGELNDIAPGERIYSARFMGGRCYLVTFKKVDPFFVIDIANPTAPAILGELKIPGYSDYLHPYDENHIIGVGKDTIEADQGDFTWYQGIKIALFDVTDVTNPTELDKEVIGERGSDSLALYDPHAFTFSRSKNLLVIPINEQDGETWGTDYQAYVFHISPERGIVNRGQIAHESRQMEYDEVYPGWDYRYHTNQVKRSFYIGDVLYTVSDEMIKANDLHTLGELMSLMLE
jgi:inhibitor of cysteine peptidase